jgi:hypothetical protein
MARASEFRPDQTDAMHCVLMRVFARIGASPIIELIAIRILEVASAGAVDPDRSLRPCWKSSLFRFRVQKRLRSFSHGCAAKRLL